MTRNVQESCEQESSGWLPNPKCQALYDGWRDYQDPYTKWIQYERGATRSVESYHTKAAERRQLVRQQLDGIVQSCRAKGCLGSKA